ncbi:hypothetical protein ERO13_D03G049150v2 [Gossypium hirsutum]|nr:hypothetical protein ERO13_D03G049150v2 [Gossypium hirsutum]
MIFQTTRLLWWELEASSAGLGVLNMAVQAVVRMTGNAETAAQNFFVLDKDVQFCTSFLAFFILFVQSLLCSFRYVMSFLCVMKMWIL